jgi:hypothetical protein
MKEIELLNDAWHLGVDACAVGDVGDSEALRKRDVAIAELAKRWPVSRPTASSVADNSARKDEIAKRIVDAIGGLPQDYNSSWQERALPLVRQLLTSYAEERTPSGEGWQQRIAAMFPWARDSNDDWRCVFCSITHCHADATVRSLQETRHAPTCLWQNAKDATPPASRGEGASEL